jgi:hypothetical protein
MHQRVSGSHRGPDGETDDVTCAPDMSEANGRPKLTIRYLQSAPVRLEQALTRMEAAAGFAQDSHKQDSEASAKALKPAVKNLPKLGPAPRHYRAHLSPQRHIVSERCKRLFSQRLTGLTKSHEAGAEVLLPPTSSLRSNETFLTPADFADLAASA